MENKPNQLYCSMNSTTKTRIRDNNTAKYNVQLIADRLCIVQSGLRRGVIYLGGYSDLSLISNMTRVGAGFSGCVRLFHVNDRRVDMRKGTHVGDALYGVDVRMSSSLLFSCPSIERCDSVA